MRKVKPVVTFTFALSGLLTLAFAALAQDAREQLRDPTRPLGFAVQTAAETRLELQAIFIRENSKEAVINGQTVNEGESVFGALVMKIDEKSVRYRKEGKSGTLKLRDSVFPKN